MEAPTLSEPALEVQPKEKGNGIADTDCVVRTPAINADPVEAEVSATDTPRLPQDWSNLRKWLVVATISFVSFVVNVSLVICAPASHAIADDLNDHRPFLLVFYITVDNLGEAISPLYVGPLSERLGRLPVVHLYNFLFLIFTMVAGFSTTVSQIVVFRFLAGASVASIALNPPIVGDLFPIEERGAAISIMSLIPILGTAVGPIAGGYITQYLNWRWTFWLTAIATAALSLVLVLSMRETYVPVIKRKASKVKYQSANKYMHGWNLKTIQSIAVLMVRPFAILFSSPVAVIMALYLSLLYGYLSLVGATMANTFQEVYGFSESSSGLVYISLTIGILSGSIFCRFTLDYFLINGLPGRTPRQESEIGAGKPYRAEDRLIPIIPAMIAFPAGLFIYGWTLQRGVHWIVPTLATSLCGFSLSSSTAPIMSYLVDIFGDRSASAIAAAIPLRYVMGAFLPIAAPYMYSSMGHGWANSLLALTLIAVAPIPLLVVLQPRSMPWLNRLLVQRETF